MPMDYARYQAEVTTDIADVLATACCQPILFVGSGFSKRYTAGPSWEELLKALAAACPQIDKEFAYYKQVYDGDFKKIGSVFTDAYREWAWGKGKNKFPSKYFDAAYPGDVFIKHMVAELLSKLGPSTKGSYGSVELDAEIAALRNMSPHAIITTNYDQVLEPLFADYEPIVGQQIMRLGFLAIGEIFKIHGCRSQPLSLILNEADYKKFETDHKYLSAKLLTYFIEHPLVFVGYRADDPNIKSVLADVHHMVGAGPGLIPNIYVLEWDPALTAASYPARDKVLSVGNDVNIRIKSISANSFEWVFKAFGTHGDLEKVNTKLLRSLMARAVDLVRSDIPKKHLEIDFKTLEHAVNTGENFAKLFGVTTLSDPSQVNLNYKYTLTQVANELGFDYWNRANDLISKVKADTGFDLKASDNAYHIKMRIGKAAGSVTNKYSEACVDLLRLVKDNKKYTLQKQDVKVS